MFDSSLFVLSLKEGRNLPATDFIVSRRNNIFVHILVCIRLNLTKFSHFIILPTFPYLPEKNLTIVKTAIVSIWRFIFTWSSVGFHRKHILCQPRNFPFCPYGGNCFSYIPWPWKPYGCPYTCWSRSHHSH